MAQNRHLFVVRIWLEPGADEHETNLRGEVLHVSSAHRFYFAHLADLLDYFILRVGQSSTTRPSDPPDQVFDPLLTLPSMGT